MDEFASKSKHALALSKKVSAASWQPLQVHHLAHDLRGPLNSILGFSELLLEGIEGILNETQTEDIVAIYQSAQNLLLLINNLIDLSKLEASTLNFDFEPVDLNKVLRSISAFDFGLSKPAHLELVVKQAEIAPSLWGDPDRIEQMILSLIRFAFNIKRAGQIVVTPRNNATNVMIQVAIAGVMLPPTEIETLFELKVKVDATGRSELGKGGLDLPLAQRLAESHGGWVGVESNEQIGTNLHLVLPIHNEADKKTSD